MRRKTGFKILRHDRSTTAGAVLGVVAIVFLVGQQLAVLFGLFTFMSVLVFGGIRRIRGHPELL